MESRWKSSSSSHVRVGMRRAAEDLVDRDSSLVQRGAHNLVRRVRSPRWFQIGHAGCFPVAVQMDASAGGYSSCSAANRYSIRPARCPGR